ncbi:MAG: flippase activity-associated protein Agl23 [archaeon]
MFKTNKVIRWHYIFFAIIALSFFLRLFMLDNRILHHDEGTNAYFFVNGIIKDFKFNYDPVNFHGPMTYYLAAIPVVIFGESIFDLRLASAIIGASIVLLFFPLRKYLGDIGTLFAACLAAISPTMAYFSRYLISFEIFLFFSMCMLVLSIGFIETKNKAYFYLLSLFSSFALLTNEVFFVLPLLVVIYFVAYFTFAPKKREEIITNVKKYKLNAFDYIAFAALFLFVLFALQSQLFTNLNNIARLPQTIFSNADKSYSTGHNKEMAYYLKLLLKYETVLAIALFLSLFFLPKTEFEKFAYFTAYAIFGIFSIIAYKTPWVLTITLLPMFLVAGIVFERIIGKGNWQNTRFKPAFAAVIAVALAWTLGMCIYTNFTYPNDEDKNELAYVQQNQGFLDLISAIEKHANALSEKPHILITANNYFPIPNYLKKYEPYMYMTNIKNLNIKDYEKDNYDMIISEDGQWQEIPLDEYDIERFHTTKYYDLLLVTRK